MESPSSHPPKKRRFFKDDLDDNISLVPQIRPPSIGPPTPPNSSNPHTPAQPGEQQPPVDTFAAQLIVIIGEPLPAHVLRSLEEASAGNLERAVNMYFDGSLSEHVTRVESPTKGLMPTSSSARHESTLNNFVIKMPASSSAVQLREKRKSPGSTARGPGLWKRKYIGSFGVEGWAVGSGSNLLKAGDPLLIERQTPPSPLQRGKSTSSKTTQSKSKTAPPARFPIPNGKQPKQHVLVRFSTLQGKEIGRLPQETASYVSTLLDQGICSFDGVCIFSPDRIRTGDNIVIQLRCYLLPKIFDPLTAKRDDERPAAWEISETEEERSLKLRRLALIQLFTAIGLDPVRSNARQTAQAREQLLATAQITEAPIRPGPAKMARTSSSQSGASEEDDEGREIADETLNMLYKKAQMYDPNMPIMEAPPSFMFELRKYQKQALCWMVGKEEGGENDVRRRLSLNPLWEEYQWPRSEDNGNEDAGSDEKFYLNPYSGEMSLILPTIESIQKGGILADGPPRRVSKL